jgi:hypothetical protein
MSENESRELVMNKDIETPITYGETEKQFVDSPIDASEEFEWLMSLALDDALDAEEATRLEMLLQQESGNLDRWMAWQAVDSSFQEMPRVLPSPDFSETFGRRLVIQERQRKLRTGFIFGVAAVALWGSALLGIVILGALMWSNQVSLLGGLIQNVNYWWIAAQQFGRALINTIEALLSAPQTRALVVCYLALVVAILAGWFMFLRRSTREMTLADAQFVEA